MTYRRWCGCLISLFYIKPQRAGQTVRSRKVVLYLYSTSNHNYPTRSKWRNHVVLYLYSTSNHNDYFYSIQYLKLSYIFILHQTTTMNWSYIFLLRCLISLFYIKPQLLSCSYRSRVVVLYLYSTSNHNYQLYFIAQLPVVLYLYSTSNHNCSHCSCCLLGLSYIFILHQTTTLVLSI